MWIENIACTDELLVWQWKVKEAVDSTPVHSEFQLIV